MARMALPPCEAARTLAASLDDAGDAVAPAVGAAVEARDRLQGGIEPDDEAVGAARRPRLVHAHGLDPAALQRLQEAGAGGERRRDPVRPLDLAHHGGAVIVLQQHELDQPVARREQRQPCTAASRGREARGIAGQLGQQRLRRATLARDRDQAMPPAFRHHDALALDQDAVGKGEIAGQALGRAGLKANAPQGSAGVFLHQVDRPVRGAMLGRSLCDQQVIGAVERQRGGAGEIAEARGRQALVGVLAAVDCDGSIVAGDGEGALRPRRHRGDGRGQLLDALRLVASW